MSMIVRIRVVLAFNDVLT